MAAIDFRGATTLGAHQCWQELVNVVDELMAEAAEAARAYDVEHGE